ncbi:MAG: Cys-tRNA(Pro) deacylase [Synergistaceae bacterium]|jgi:Cys-tRNA(Pro)/Cys-tRNA(Cys) deacylase|nr:Cys-tRNA(Pro) deacylase [Synergistaceae bacterium]
MRKTNAMRILDNAGIAYTFKEYEAEDGDHLGARAAAFLGMPCERVFKTLVLKGTKEGHFVCCVPVDRELDLKKVALAAGEKKVEMLPVRDLQKITGYVRGGCSPVGMKKKFPVFVDRSALSFGEIAVNAGTRGLQVLLAPEDLRAVASASFADLTGREEES